MQQGTEKHTEGHADFHTVEPVHRPDEDSFPSRRIGRRNKDGATIRHTRDGLPDVL